VLGRTGAPGGAELVYLRQPAGKASPDAPKVRAQDGWQPGTDGEPSTPEQQLRRAVVTLRGEQFHASSNQFCSSCEFRRLCPLQPEGTFVLSALDDTEGEGAADDRR
jgi:hypothetical protein